MFAYYYDTQEILARNVFVIVDSMLMYKLMRMAVDKWSMNWLEKISVASFFIYLFHEPWLGYIQGMFFKFIYPSGVICYVMPWFFCAFAVTYSYVMCCALRKIFPKLLNIITGSR